MVLGMYNIGWMFHVYVEDVKMLLYAFGQKERPMSLVGSRLSVALLLSATVAQIVMQKEEEEEGKHNA